MKLLLSILPFVSGAAALACFILSSMGVRDRNAAMRAWHASIDDERVPSLFARASCRFKQGIAAFAIAGTSLASYFFLFLFKSVAK